MHIKNTMMLLVWLTIIGMSNDSLPITKHTKQKEIIALLNKKIQTSQKKLGKKYHECRVKAANNRIQFDWNTTKVSKEEIAVATIYIFSNNQRKCPYREEQQFFHDLRVLMFFKKREKLDFEDETIQLSIEFATLDDELERELNYLALPYKAREYLENALGDMPCGVECIEDFYAQRKKLSH